MKHRVHDRVMPPLRHLAALAFGLALGFAAAPVPAHAGEPAATGPMAEVSMVAPVLEVRPAAGGGLDLVIGRGQFHGLAADAVGNVFEAQEKSGIGAVAARAKITRVTLDRAEAHVAADPRHDLAAITPRSHMEVTVRLPRGIHRGILLDLALNGIIFLDNARQPLATLDELLSARDGAVEERALAAMVRCGHEVIEFTTEMTTPIARGKWKGRVMADVLRESAVEDYRAFLRFVASFPGKYIGTAWKISETYATWLMNNAPPSDADRFAELLAATGEAFEAFAREESDERFAKFVAGRRVDVQSWPHSRRTEAWEALDTLERAAKARANKPPAEVETELLHLRARLLDDDRETLGAAAKAYEALSERYFAQGNHHEGMVALSNALHTLHQLGRDDEVLARAPAVLARFRREATKITDPMVRAHVPMREAFVITLEARILRQRGQYREVVERLEPLIGTFEAVGHEGWRDNELSLMTVLAGVRVKMGEDEAAKALYGRMEQLAEAVGDDARRADLAWDTAELAWARSRWLDAAREYARMATLAQRSGEPAKRAKALAAEGQALWQVGRYADALARHEAALAVREALGDRSGLAWQLVEMGKILIDAGDRDRARTLFERALGTYRALEQPASAAGVLEELGKLDRALTLLDSARAAFEEARATYAKLKLAPAEARALEGIASVELKAGAFRDATKTIAKAIAIFKRIGAASSLATAMYWQGRVLAAEGARTEARRVYTQALAAVGDDKALRAEGLTNLGSLEFSDADLAGAAAHAQEALALAEGANDVAQQIEALALLEDVQATRADFDGALELNARRLALAKESGQRPQQVFALTSRATKLVEIGRLADARAATEEALPLARQNGDDVALAWVYDAQARVHRSYGDLRAELEAQDEAVRLMERANYPFGIGAMVFNRSLFFTRIRDLDRALADNLRAEKIGGASFDVMAKARVHLGRGQVHRYAKRYAEAEKALNAALAIARKHLPDVVAPTLRELGRLHEERGRVDQAVAVLKEAVALEGAMAGRQHAALAQLGIVLAAAGRDAEAAPVLEDALARASERGGALPWEALYRLAMVKDRAGATDEAVALLHKAVREVERGEVVLGDDAARTRYRADKTGVYRYLIKLLLGEGQIEDALRYLERSKVNELTEIDRRAGPGGDPTVALATELDVQEGRLAALLDAELTKANRDEAKVARLDELLASVKRRRAAFSEELDRNDALFDRYAVRPLQLEKLQEHLADGMLVLAPVILDDRVVVFAVTRTVLTHFTHTTTPAEIGALVTGFARDVEPKRATGALGAAGLARVKARARQLYDMLVGPAFEAVGTPETLVVSASGALRYIPFAALHDGEGWLVEKTRVVNVTALDREKFANAPPPPTGPSSVLALVDPDGTLPGARLEIAEVQKANAKVDVFEGADATLALLRGKVRVPGYDIVHLATHGRLDAEHPERSHILLAGVPLSYADIPTLSPSRTRLVVLSACQTAVHSGGSGVEIAGLAYQFQRSSVDSVLATLWEVDDEASAEVMGRFYSKLTGGVSYAEALALAQRDVIADADLDLQHPAYWAPYFLMGTP